MKRLADVSSSLTWEFASAFNFMWPFKLVLDACLIPERIPEGMKEDVVRWVNRKKRQKDLVSQTFSAKFVFY